MALAISLLSAGSNDAACVIGVGKMVEMYWVVYGPCRHSLL